MSIAVHVHRPVSCIHACRHQEYIVDGESYMRVKFYVDGSRRKGEAHLDLKKVFDPIIMLL